MTFEMRDSAADSNRSLKRGTWSEARARLEQALTQADTTETREELTPARIALEVEQTWAAAALVDRFVRTVPRANGPHRAAAQEWQVRIASLAGSDLEWARRCLEEAADLFECGRILSKAARARLEPTGVLTGLGSVDPAPGNSSALTARQAEILRLVAEGHGDRQIAAGLGLSEHTVHRHVANILTRLDVPTRAAATALATARGWI
ncbi:helix-turn-helix transcriptional regulator [Pseudactinotalea sp. Z1748]|uniref:helix-turn-helix transcriptional regulator n=1 Tax=Pseudactinotalea sp. Z1748 TaxID=3413027 RepID=UPI003C7B6135